MNAFVLDCVFVIIKYKSRESCIHISKSNKMAKNHNDSFSVCLSETSKDDIHGIHDQLKI